LPWTPRGAWPRATAKIELGGPRGDIEPGGINKTDITRTAAGRAVSALAHDDEVGRLAFNTSSNWVVPLQQLPPDELEPGFKRRARPDAQPRPGPPRVEGAAPAAAEPAQNRQPTTKSESTVSALLDRKRRRH